MVPIRHIKRKAKNFFARQKAASANVPLMASAHQKMKIAEKNAERKEEQAKKKK